MYNNVLVVVWAMYWQLFGNVLAMFSNVLAMFGGVGGRRGNLQIRRPLRSGVLNPALETLERFLKTQPTIVS